MRSLAFLLALLFTLPAWSREVVRVGGYEFAPYVEIQDEKPTGLTIELIDQLNRVQDRFDFQFELTSPRRRYEDFSSGRIDVIFFENPEWGWTARGIKLGSSREFLRDSEVFVALAASGRDERYFAALNGRSIAGIYGYHYAFAKFIDDPKILEQDYRMSLVYSNFASIQLVLSGRVDLAIVTRSYLDRFLRENPQDAARLLVSKRTDQIYSLRALVREQAPISVEEIEVLLGKLRKRGTLDKLWRAAGVVN
ncbi:MAG TPA: transporter substrate-binding domain-containing protein [Rhodocyclaceae bacterium]|nr:transporter substrate-binding domain-containing protein [Rhodocyclaceae bacterium]